MAIEQTLSIIKPDAVAAGHADKINAVLEQAGLNVVAQKQVKLSKAQAAEFYKEHKDRPFFQELMDYITSGEVVVQVLEGEDAVAKNRKVMGATDPKKAEAGTIRAEFASSIEANAVHGSDSLQSAEREIDLFAHMLELGKTTQDQKQPAGFRERLEQERQSTSPDVGSTR